MKMLMIVFATLLLAAPATADFGLWCEFADEVRVDVDGADVTVFHDAALYNCCPDPFAYDAHWESDRLVIAETEVLTNPCFCVCCFDLSTTVENVPPGDWVLRFVWFDSEATAWTEVEVPFTVGDVGQGGPASVGESGDSGCLTSSDVDALPATMPWGQVKAGYR
ncbi:hypothetical protein H8E07_03530 [bacterium]|nr:hypothetical protein [bacterium]